MEDIVRSHSVVPATIGVINGDIHVGKSLTNRRSHRPVL